MQREHTSTQYERTLRLLKDKLLLMGYLAEQMIADSIRAIEERRSDVAEEVIARDDTIDQLEIEIDNVCYEILALQQPVASDLRFIATALKIVRELERIGDTAVNITRRTLELLSEPALKRLIALPVMANASQGILRHSLDAFVTSNVQLAEKVIQSDCVIDDIYEEIFRELLAYMFEDARNVSRALKLIFIAKHLERVGDHSANIAEMVIFMVKGQDVRHGGAFARRRVLFISIGNSARSQMAEAILRSLAGDRYEVFSAGTEPKGLHPRTVDVMKEIGVETRGQESKHLNLFSGQLFDHVITVCERAKQNYPVFPGAEPIHWGFDDPVESNGDELTAFRRVRDEILQRIRLFLSADRIAV